MREDKVGPVRAVRPISDLRDRGHHREHLGVGLAGGRARAAEVARRSAPHRLGHRRQHLLGHLCRRPGAPPHDLQVQLLLQLVAGMELVRLHRREPWRLGPVGRKHHLRRPALAAHKPANTPTVAGVASGPVVQQVPGVEPLDHGAPELHPKRHVDRPDVLLPYFHLLDLRDQHDRQAARPRCVRGGGEHGRRAVVRHDFQLHDHFKHLLDLRRLVDASAAGERKVWLDGILLGLVLGHGWLLHRFAVDWLDG
mmetsp:Transcript_18223/g.52078  ORF Transcript_18223/g.52078 Transcript_18223/m.52078 type:complete len:253 (+) Transcript_18223:279-1037(+)